MIAMCPKLWSGMSRLEAQFKVLCNDGGLDLERVTGLLVQANAWPSSMKHLVVAGVLSSSEDTINALKFMEQRGLATNRVCDDRCWQFTEKGFQHLEVSVSLSNPHPFMKYPW